jgi:hypothetical protein
MLCEVYSIMDEFDSRRKIFTSFGIDDKRAIQIKEWMTTRIPNGLDEADFLHAVVDSDFLNADEKFVLVYAIGITKGAKMMSNTLSRATASSERLGRMWFYGELRNEV